MSFPPRFLDELRARLSLAEIVGRRVRLVRKGREYAGLCPFHNEKTPSFYVVEEKGFFHCFGCGAHGDVIGFTMQSGNLEFLEAVEALAREAGLDVPKASPQERERAERQFGLQGALEAAAAFFAEQLWRPAGAAARAYLAGRGLDEATIRRFRLGWAADSRDTLKRALGKAFAEDLLLEAGLLRRPEDGGASYDWFRRRVIFPIGDRSGRVVAFGGRALGDAQPKYLNSPETPLFQKGRILYGWAPARAAAARAPSAIVTEGYMDVIALHRAGFGTAVAPLGTALTEMQIEELWKLASEPVLCFDGDAAGERAALRAAERALPLLKPGFSLRFATLPAGEDPDTLLLRQGAAAMQEVLDRARPLAEVIWATEWARRPPDTPERRADLERRLEERVRHVADRSVQAHYRRHFRNRLFESFRATRPQAGGRKRKLAPEPPPLPRTDPTLLRRRQQEILMAVVLNHPFLLDEVAEDFAAFDFGAAELDKLRREILDVFSLRHDLDAERLKLHLSQAGYARTVDALLCSGVYVHAAFARPGASAEAARRGWDDTRSWFKDRPALVAQIAREEQDLAANMSEQNWARLAALQRQREEEEGAAGEAFS